MLNAVKYKSEKLKSPVTASRLGDIPPKGLKVSFAPPTPSQGLMLNIRYAIDYTYDNIVH